MDIQERVVSLKHHAGLGVNFLISALIAPLPTPWRRSLEHRIGLDVDHAGALSGILQLFLGLGLWGLGYWLWYRALDAQMLAAARRMGDAGTYDQESYSIIGASALAMSPLLTIIYTLTSPIGFVTMLATLGGLTRTVAAAATGENVADPTLLAVSWVADWMGAKRRLQHRTKAKGEASPDRLQMGDAKADGYDLRVTTADELGWRVGGSVIVAGEAFFVVESKEIRDEAGRLRMRHDLRRLRSGEILRAPTPYRPGQPPEIILRPPP